MKNTKKLNVLGGFCLAGSMLLGTAAAAQESIKIGLLLPYKGVYAPLATDIDKAWEVALAEFGGEVAGMPVEVFREDTELNPQIGIQKFNKLIDSDEVDLMAGAISSGVAVSMTELAERRKMPTVFAMAFADVVTGQYCNPYVARTSFSARAYQYGSGAYWAKRGVKTAVTLGPDYVAGHAFIDAFAAGFTETGGEVLEAIWTPFKKTKDWSTPLAKARQLGPEIIYSFYAGAEAIQVVKQHAAFGLKETAPLIGGIFLYDEALWPAMGDAVVGANIVTTYHSGIDSDANRKFVDGFMKMHGTAPTVNAAIGYDNAKSILLALEELGGTFEDGKDFIAALGELDYTAPRGRMRFNDDNNAILADLYLVEVEETADGTLGHKLIDTFPGGEDLPGCEM